MTAAESLPQLAVILLAWTWIGYPLAVRAAAALVRSRACTMEGGRAAVSVIVATRDDAVAVGSRVEDLLHADWPPELLEVIVCIDEGTPPSRIAALRQLASDRVIVVDGDTPGGKAATLNAGVRAASNEILVFTDVQQRFAPDAIRHLVRAILSDPRTAIVGGALQLPGDASGATRTPVEWYWWAERRLRADEARLHSAVGVSGSIYAMRRSFWRPLPALLILDDVFVPMQAVMRGARVGYTLDAHAWDVRRTDPEQERGRKVRTLTGVFQLVAWLPELLVPWRNPIWCQFVCHKLLRLLSPWLIGVVAVGAVIAIFDTVPEGGRPVVLGSTILVTTAAFVLPPFGRRLRALARWGWSLQLAVLQATSNGLRGRWDVWR